MTDLHLFSQYEVEPPTQPQQYSDSHLQPKITNLEPKIIGNILYLGLTAFPHSKVDFQLILECKEVLLNDNYNLFTERLALEGEVSFRGFYL